MLRKIIKINEEKCNGCGACAKACHEGAIAMVDGKAKLTREDYCDGLGDCLPNCPTGAITFEEREAAAYDKQAVAEHRRAIQGHFFELSQSHGCKGAQIREMSHTDPTAQSIDTGEPISALRNWPVQIKLAPVKAPYFDKAELLVAADCTAYAYAAFHREMMRGKVTLIGCPKLDGVDYSVKLTEILRQNDIQSITVARMEVPCCGGLEAAVNRALRANGKCIPQQVVTVSTDGHILESGGNMDNALYEKH